MTKPIRAAAAFIAGCALVSACSPVDQQTAGADERIAANPDGPVFDATSPFEVATVTKANGKVLVDVGNGMVEQDPSKPMRLAYLIQGTDNAWLQAHVQGATDQAKKLGVELTVFDAGFDGATQYSQYQNALEGGKFDAFVVIAADSVGSCDILTSAAPKKNVLVGVVNQPLCDRGDQDNLGAWSPGTVSTVVGTGSPAFYEAVADEIGESLDEETSIAYITGPAGNTSVEAQRRSLEAAAERYPNIEGLFTAYTDYSPAAALKETQNLLAAHPEINVVVSNFTSSTTGIMQGVSSAGRDDIKIFENGGSGEAVKLIKDGKIEGSVALFPYTASACMVDLLNKAHQGEEVPRVVLNDCEGGENGGKTETPLIVTKSNVDDYTPVY